MCVCVCVCGIKGTRLVRWGYRVVNNVSRLSSPVLFSAGLVDPATCGEEARTPWPAAVVPSSRTGSHYMELDSLSICVLCICTYV